MAAELLSAEGGEAMAEHDVAAVEGVDAELQEIFQSFDLNRDGVLSHYEVGEMMRALSFTVRARGRSAAHSAATCVQRSRHRLLCAQWRPVGGGE